MSWSRVRSTLGTTPRATATASRAWLDSKAQISRCSSSAGRSLQRRRSVASVSTARSKAIPGVPTTRSNTATIRATCWRANSSQPSCASSRFADMSSVTASDAGRTESGRLPALCDVRVCRTGALPLRQHVNRPQRRMCKRSCMSHRDVRSRGPRARSSAADTSPRNPCARSSTPTRPTELSFPDFRGGGRVPRRSLSLCRRPRRASYTTSRDLTVQTPSPESLGQRTLAVGTQTARAPAE